MKLNPKIIAIILVVVFGLAAAGYDRWATPHGMKPVTANSKTVVYEQAPDLSFVTLEGEKYTLNDLPEQGVLLHFWASWCTTCIAEFPDLLESVVRADGKVALVAVSIDDDRERMERYLEKSLRKKASDNVDFPSIYWVWDEGKEISLKTFNVLRVPETVFINSQGEMVKKTIGEADWMGSDMTAIYAGFAQE